jgi:predicted DNA-binding protein YlxM (UPF0122 family)
MSKDSQLDKFVLFSTLFDVYGPLLTDKQQAIMEQYYGQNLSLQEIAELTDITRAAVNDALTHAQDKLLHYEAQLHLVEKQKKLKLLIDQSSLTAEEKTNLLSLL